MNSKITPERNQSIDVLRGLMMFYIVFIIHGLFLLKLAPEIVRSSLLFEMPVIFIISGFALNLAESHKKSRAQTSGLNRYLAFMLARISRILLPFWAYGLVCAALYWGYSYANGQTTVQFLQVLAAWLNPFADRSQFSIDFLNPHLWFIPTFLIITAILPFAINVRLPVHVPLWILMLAATVVIYLLSRIDFPESALLKSVFFYLLWAVFGYHIATLGVVTCKADYVKIMLISIVGLAACFSLSTDPGIANMQRNKFPPNAIFFLFNCIWVGIFLSLASFYQQGSLDLVNKLAKQIWLKPFISGGYSIYLWQGLGYTLAVRLGNYLDLPVLITWLNALIFTVVLGLLALPIERIRIRF